MAASELIAPGTGAANSADIVVTDGTSVTVFLKDAAGPAVPADCCCDVLLKDETGQYFKIGELSGYSVETRAVTMSGPGTYRISRTAGNCGVSRAG